MKKFLSSLLAKKMPQAPGAPGHRELRKAHDELELRTEERPADLVQATKCLEAEIAVRQRTEEQLTASLQENKDLKTALGEHAIVAATDPQGRITYVNDKFCTISKFARMELLGQDHRVLNSGHHAKEYIRNLWTTIGQGLVWHGEMKNKAKDGTFYWVDATIVPFLGLDGKPRQYVAISTDITERKRTEEALRESEAHYRLLADNLADVLWTFDLQSMRCTYVSPSVQRMCGYTAAEVNALSLEQILSPESFALVQSLLDGHKGAFLAGDPSATTHVHEFDLIRKDGSIVHTETITSFVRNDDGRISVVGVARDITERKRAEEVLRWRTTMFEALMDSSPDGILVVDGHGEKILQNQRVGEIWKIPQHIFQDPDDAEQVRFVAARTKNPQQFAEKVAYLYAHSDEVSLDEIDLIDGTVLDRYSSPVRDKNGTHYGRIWIFRNMTGQRQLEAQLRQAQKMEAIGQLAGGVAHDFNNILSATLMHLGLLMQNSQLTLDTKESLKEVEKEALRAANLTRQLLLFSRRQAARIEPLDMNILISNLLKMLRRLLGENIEVAFQSSTGAAWVNADAGMLEQVVMNLCINSRDAMPNGGALALGTALVKLEGASARLHPDARPGSFVCLSVTDGGCGMDDTVMEKIFDPFFTTKEAGKGTGLGLATVYGIVKQHQGWIEVESAVGQGSSFRVYLPATSPLGAFGIPGDDEEIKGGSETILLVEDELFLRRLTALCLRKLGYAVLEADNGLEALKVWEQHHQKIALLFTDMVMPGSMTGLDLAMRLRKEKETLKIISSSGYNTDMEGPPLTGDYLFAQTLCAGRFGEGRAVLSGQALRDALEFELEVWILS